MLHFYSLLYFKATGTSPLVTENVSRAVKSGVMYARSAMVSDNGNVKLTCESYIDENRANDWQNYVDFKAMTKDGGFPKLRLLEDASTWKEGAAFCHVLVKTNVR